MQFNDTFYLLLPKKLKSKKKDLNMAKTKKKYK